MLYFGVFILGLSERTTLHLPLVHNTIEAYEAYVTSLEFSLLHRTRISDATPPFNFCFHTHISTERTVMYLEIQLNTLSKGSASLRTHN